MEVVLALVLFIYHKNMKLSLYLHVNYIVLSCYPILYG